MRWPTICSIARESPSPEPRGAVVSPPAIGQDRAVMSMKRALVTSVLLTAALLAPGAALAPASADDPIDVTRQITDRAGVLGGQQPEVRQALDRFFDRTGLQLFVVYVPTFGDLTGSEWAAKTAEKSELGRGDVLLVMATKDRAYGYRTD